MSSGVPDLDGPNLYAYYPGVNGVDPWGESVCKNENDIGNVLATSAPIEANPRLSLPNKSPDQVNTDKLLLITFITLGATTSYYNSLRNGGDWKKLAANSVGEMTYQENTANWLRLGLTMAVEYGAILNRLGMQRASIYTKITCSECQCRSTLGYWLGYDKYSWVEKKSEWVQCEFTQKMQEELFTPDIRVFITSDHFSYTALTFDSIQRLFSACEDQALEKLC